LNWTDLPFFQSDIYKKDIVEHLVKDMNNGESILPAVSNIMSAFDKTPLNNVKVCILGQDPYPTKGHANGLAFSVEKNVSPLPKSLQNIFIELETDVGVTRSNGDLTDWAEQGVLLLNTCLTVIEGRSGSHLDLGWDELTKEVIETLNDRDGIVFILWGKKAQRYETMIDSARHCVLKAAHPSPLSAYRGFFGSRPFSKTNDFLRQKNETPIDWGEK